MASPKRKVLIVVMDGIGQRSSAYGNAVKLAQTPYLDSIKRRGLYTTLKAHGTFVGLPSDDDIGNSEVGHNALGAGRVFDQGAKLVNKAISSGSLFEGKQWQKQLSFCKQHNGTLHFLGLLSNGNVHGHIDHLVAMLRQAKQDQVAKVRIHALLDGRDVGARTAEKYIAQLEKCLGELNSPEFDARVASGGGRMSITMDRYEADWSMVERGWAAHVEGEADYYFDSLAEAVKSLRQSHDLDDQNLPGFVIRDNGQPVGPIEDGDSVILWNFRGDRAIEISRAFEDHNLNIKRRTIPKVSFAGMMQYDGDLGIPKQFLVTPPEISETLGETLVKLGVRQFACSETQKYGHVTYFWNGNRSGYLDESIEDYLEIPSENISFDLKPWMKAFEITEQTINRLARDTFDIGRINFPNGDMVGHTGNLSAAITAVSTVDLQIGRLMEACRKTGTIMVITADHGNCDEMFDTKTEGPSDWLEQTGPEDWPKPKTAHTLNEVPFYIYDPKGSDWQILPQEGSSIANIASTVLELAGLPKIDIYQPSLVRWR